MSASELLFQFEKNQHKGELSTAPPKSDPFPKHPQPNPMNPHNNSQSTQEVTQSPVRKHPLLCRSGPRASAPDPWSVGARRGGAAAVPETPRSVVDDDGPSHPQAGVGVRGGQDQALRLGLGDPAGGDGLAGLPAGVPQLGAGQHPPGPPGRGQEVVRKDAQLKGALDQNTLKYSASGLMKSLPASLI